MSKGTGPDKKQDPFFLQYNELCDQYDRKRKIMRL